MGPFPFDIHEVDEDRLLQITAQRHISKDHRVNHETWVNVALKQQTRSGLASPAEGDIARRAAGPD